MSRYGVSIEKEQQLLERMQRLGIREEDLVEAFIRGSGKGGQKINKTSSCVQLTHRPSGIEIRCQRERSQALNRFHARRMLCDKLEGQVLGELSKEEQAREKIRRQKRRRSRKAKQKMLEQKGRRSDTKRMRQSVRGDD
ncbi:MAG: peptide chain release factor-like protein [Deltaproteobacteria bacterium]|nr:peptide chain release factor-like protein [Deltaproteobacteria bacterium]